MSDTETEKLPTFARADLMPIIAQWDCPVCGTSHTTPELTEDDSGEWRVGAEDRFVQCDECEAFVDVGWAGWRWHDGAAQASETGKAA